MAAPAGAILALNAGSSSIKFGLFSEGVGDPLLIARGEIERSKDRPLLTVVDAAGRRATNPIAANLDADGLVAELLGQTERYLGGRPLRAAGHRVVHGGSSFVAPVLLTPDRITALRALTPLAPLHQPVGLDPVDALARLRPDLPQIACFDTAFHHDLRPPVSRYALPRQYEDKGIRRYGFHGLSYAFIARRLAEISPHLAARRTVVAHLGNGASLCAMRGGKSVDTTMGFSALDGLVMGTRTGGIDPGILLYLLQEEGLAPRQLEDLLYRRSGLLGVSGISSDMRTLLASDSASAREAVELFVFRVARETAAMANSLGGLEALVFTGGIGEHAAPIRAMVAERLGWLGVKLDPDANDRNAQRVDLPQSRVEVLVLPTDEELTIARHVAVMVKSPATPA